MSSKRRYMPSASHDIIDKAPDGTTLCRWCKKPVPTKRRTFCSDACVVQWRLRTDGRFLRQMVLARDSGVCVLCGLDTQRLARRLRAARRNSQADYEGTCRKYGYTPKEGSGSLWHADHICPVADGGGEADLHNLRTLCIPCHKKITSQWKQQRKKRKTE